MFLYAVIAGFFFLVVCVYFMIRYGVDVVFSPFGGVDEDNFVYASVFFICAFVCWAIGVGV